MKSKTGNAMFGFLVILFILVVLFLILYAVSYALARGSEDIVIEEKWSKYHGDDAKYLVSATSGEVYEISDSWIRWRWDSSDLYAYLKPGMNCSIAYQGWRAPFFSDYKNIITANCTGG